MRRITLRNVLIVVVGLLGLLAGITSLYITYNDGLDLNTQIQQLEATRGSIALQATGVAAAATGRLTPSVPIGIITRTAMAITPISPTSTPEPSPVFVETLEVLTVRIEEMNGQIADLQREKTQTEVIISQEESGLPKWLQYLLALVTILGAIGTILFAFWNERRERVMHELELAEKELEVEKRRKEMEQSQQKGKKR